MARGRSQATKIHPKVVSSSAMAVKMKPAPTVSEETTQASKTRSAQLIKQQQSTEVVQTLLHGSISCLSYLRNLFPEKCFDDRYYETSDTHWSYEDYIQGREPQTKDKGRPGTSLKVLRRGSSDGVDKFLTWLEDGAFDALKRNVLRAIQLNIFEQADKPNDVVETYTFTFNYVKSADRSTVLAGLEMQGPRGESVTVKTARHGLQMFIRRLLALCNTLPDLPERRYLTMHLFYTDDCDADYEPPGFEKSQNTQIRFPENDAWQKLTQSCGTMDAGFHTVSLKVSHLHHVQDTANDKEVYPSEIPSGLPYTAAALREDDVDIRQVAESAGDAPPGAPLDVADTQGIIAQASDANSIATTTRLVQQPQSVATRSKDMATDPMPVITEDAEESRGHDDGMDVDAVSHGPHETASMQNRNLTQQAREGRPETQRLDVAPETAAVSDSQQTTQVLEEDLKAKAFFEKILESSVPSQSESLEETQPIEHSGNAHRPFHGISEQMSMLHLSQKKIEELDNRKLQLAKGLLGRTRNARGTTNLSSHKDKDVVDCQCGWNEEEEDMINCCFCDTWQHLHCYGYLGADDPRIPDVHACYKCLLQEKEAPLLRDMQDLALLRKGVHIIQTDGGYFNDRKFSDSLHCDLQTASRVFKHLQKGGYVLSNPGYKSKGYRATGKPTHRLVSSGPDFLRLMREYFDPRTKIAHHFELPQGGVAMTGLTTQYPVPPTDSAEPVQSSVDAMEVERHGQLDMDETQDEDIPFHSSPSAAAALRSKSARQQPSQALSRGTSGTARPKSNGWPGTNWTSARQLLHRPTPGGSALQERDANLQSPFSTPKKRARDENGSDKETQDDEFAPVSARTRKKLKSSMTQGIVDIGCVASPSQSPAAR